MNIAKHFLTFILILLASFQSSAETTPAESDDSTVCRVSLELNQEEKSAYIGFHAALSHLQGYYGTDRFQLKLNEIIAKQWPEKKVIEISPVFMEKILNLVDQQYLRDSIAKTIGLDSDEWSDFERKMKYVLLAGYTTENKYGQFTKKTEQLVNKIKNIDRNQMKKKTADKYEADVLKARAVTQIANMAFFLGRWSILNNEIAQNRADAAGKQLLFNAMTLSASGLLVASLVYAGPVVVGAGVFASSLTTDVVVAAQFARLGQIAAGVGMGVVGAPTALLFTDSTSAVMEAGRNAANNHSVYACELDKQMKNWKRKGVSPYISASIVGGGVGAVGGVLTLSAAGAKVVLLATSFGVGFAELETLGQINVNGMKALAEYRLAIQANDQGDNATARLHLQKSRDYAQKSGEKLLEGIVVGALSLAIGSEFKAALHEGEAMIRVVFANSSDTLPMALGIAKDSVQQLMAK
jgi:hypothetical protein